MKGIATYIGLIFFSDRQVAFINFNDLTEAEAIKVLSWRNHKDIRKCMYRKEEISLEEHFRFLEQLSIQNKRFYWVVKERDRLLGVIDIVDYHFSNSEWGFYLNPDLTGLGLGIHLVYHALNFFFKTLGIKALYGYCHYRNIKGLLFHDVFGIVHVGYQQISTSTGKDWYSKRIIISNSWLQKDISIAEIEARRQYLKTFDHLEEKKLKLDQIFLDVF